MSTKDERFVLDLSQPGSTYTDPGSAQPHRVIRLIDADGYNAEVLVRAEPHLLDSLYEQVMQALAARFPRAAPWEEKR